MIEKKHATKSTFKTSLTVFKIFLLLDGNFFKLIFYSILHLEFKNDICTSLKG